MRPVTPQELLDQLTGIFPQFCAYWESEDNPWRDESGFTFHGVMLDFSDFIRGLDAEPSGTQWRTLGQIFNVAVEKDDQLENAVATCFLEHLHRMELRKNLWPHLDGRARRKTHA